jgi:hypothetical protein
MSLVWSFERYALSSVGATNKFTEYFENEVLRKRTYLKKEWCIRVLEEPLRSELQEGNRYRFGARLKSLRDEF